MSTTFSFGDPTSYATAIGRPGVENGGLGIGGIGRGQNWHDNDFVAPSLGDAEHLIILGREACEFRKLRWGGMESSLYVWEGGGACGYTCFRGDLE